MVRSVHAAIAALTALAGCDPAIVSGSYLCGPQMSCPPGEVCSAGTGTCVRPERAVPFSCLAGSGGGEPNDDAVTAAPLVVAGCPAGQVELLGCVPVATDVDWIAVDSPLACAGGALSIDVRYSAAFAPPIVDLMTSAGTVAQTAAQCDITGGIGANDAVCLDTVVPVDGRALVRVTLDTELDCEGACAFAHYSVTASAVAP